MTAVSVGPQSQKWVTLATHRAWLLARAEELLAVFQKNARNPKGGFHDLDDTGAPMLGKAGDLRALHATTRMVHCFSIAQLMGRPGAAAMIDHGMDYIWNAHRDRVHGGYLWSLDNDGPVDDTKQAYGHAFVLLAGSSAKVAGHPDADRLIADITEVLDARYWEEEHGAVAEEFTRDWRPYDSYRGQNSNMHLTEALMAAFEATRESDYLRRAERIAELIISRHARAENWHLPEHFSEDWQLNRDYSGSPMFRPYGTTPGHSLEWARLLLQLWELGQRRLDWLPEASKALFARAITDGWDHATGGFYYTLEWDGAPRIRHRYWWPCCEGIGAAAFLNAIDGAPLYEEWYQRIWGFVADHFIDPNYGGWFPQLDEELKPNADPFFGKPDIYHSLQACLIPLLPTSGSVTAGLVETGIRL